VLVVDDNEDAANSLCTLIRLWGHDAQAAYDGRSGLERAVASRPDCIFLDLGLPGMDGYELARRLRARAEFGATRLVALSAYSDREASRRAGFDGHLVKPADPAQLEELLKMMTEVLDVANRTRHAAEQTAELAKETRGLIGEAREEIKEVKTELREVKTELREVKEELREVKEVIDKDQSEGGPAAGA
jgi:CheY-like chemotaxis protein